MTAPVFVVDHFDTHGTGRYVLDGPEGRHAVAVKRLRAGEEVVLTDGAGRWAAGEVDGTEGKDRLIVRLGEVVEEPAQTPRLTVVQALPKGDRGELAVETMTEVGVDAIVPWSASRCITQWKGERGAKSLAKWRATAREAGKQSRRVSFPVVADAATSRGLRHFWPKRSSRRCCTRAGRSRWPTSPCPPRVTSCWSSAPKAGWPRGVGAVRERGARAYRLGRSVLRTSTAGTAAEPQPRSFWAVPAAGPDVPGFRPGPRSSNAGGAEKTARCALPSRGRRWHAAVHGGVEQDSARDARPAAAGARRRLRRGRRRRCGRL